MKRKILLILSSILLITGCTKNNDKVVEPQHVDENPIVTMTIKDYGDIVIELYPNEAYNTVANFVTLIENGFYNNNIINRIQKGFVIQGGAGKDIDYSIEGEFAKNGKTNNISHEKGVISMARTDFPDSAGGQFFIMLDDDTSLNGLYAAFGKVINGMDVVEKIAETEFDDYEVPSMGFLKAKDYITIEKTIVDTKGYTYQVNKIKK